MDVVELVRERRCSFEWYPMEVELDGYKLLFTIMRDAMKFDGVPAMTWDLKPIDADTSVMDGVRLPATAAQLQQIADMLGAMLMTPKVVDLLWLESQKGGVHINSIINNGKPKPHFEIVANMDILDVHRRIEDAIDKAGGDNGGVVDSVGKYWVMVNQLLNLAANWACNYGWPDESAPAHRRSVMNTHCVWQTPGYGHGDNHFDPSQTIRLMHRSGLLVSPNGTIDDVDLHYILQHDKLCHMLSHEGPLKVLRQRNVDPVEPIGWGAPTGVS